MEIRLSSKKGQKRVSKSGFVECNEFFLKPYDVFFFFCKHVLETEY